MKIPLDDLWKRSLFMKISLDGDPAQWKYHLMKISLDVYPTWWSSHLMKILPDEDLSWWRSRIKDLTWNISQDDQVQRSRWRSRQTLRRCIMYVPYVRPLRRSSLTARHYDAREPRFKAPNERLKGLDSSHGISCGFLSRFAPYVYALRYVRALGSNRMVERIIAQNNRPK